MAAEIPQTTGSRRSLPDHVTLDGDSAQVTESAVYQLSVLRSPMGHGDGLLRVHALATLITQAHAVLADAVADARDQDHPWSDIAAQLDVTPQTARRRYSRHQPSRRPPTELD